jgi:MarR family transcriptional regulator, organic hydroperoxide resistance regulator
MPSEEPLLRFMQAYLRHAVEDMTAVLQENELSMPQLGALHYLRAEGSQSVSHIARHLNLSLTATSHLVERLVGKGLVERAEDETDRRQKRVTLSPVGWALLEGVHSRATASLMSLLAGVSADKRLALERAVAAVVADLESPDA